MRCTAVSKFRRAASLKISIELRKVNYTAAELYMMKTIRKRN